MAVNLLSSFSCVIKVRRLHGAIPSRRISGRAGHGEIRDRQPE